MQVFNEDAALLGPERVARYVASPIGEVAESPGRAAEPTRYMKMVDGHCAALERGADGSYGCAVYEHRPTLCRVLERGSSKCLEAREQLG